MKHKRLDYSKIRKANKKEMEESIRIHEEYSRLGIDVSTFSESKKYTKDEIAAMKFIVENKPIPSDLEQRLLQKKAIDKKDTEKSSQEIRVTDEELEAFLS